MIQGRFVSEAREQKIVEEIFRKVSGNRISHDIILDPMDTLVQALVYEGAEDNCPTAAGSMILKKEEARIVFVTVLPEYRGKSYGEFLIRMMVDKAKTSGIQRITLWCEDSMSAYFQKFGFEADEEKTKPDEIVCINMTYKAIDGKCCSKSI